jgi:hypothetical protein
MRTHCDDISDALALIEPVLRSWEANADLTLSREEVRFDFVTADVVDRAPLLAGSGRMRVLAAQTGHFAVGGMNVTLCAERARYPEPPYRFRLTPDAKSLLDRYNGYLDGREPLPAMAYFCLTMLEAIAGSRPGAAKHFGIDSKVLSKVGEVTANRGDLLTARKGRAIQPLTSKERAWLEAAVRAFIYRVGDTRPISTLPTLTMADLPKLQ